MNLEQLIEACTGAGLFTLEQLVESIDYQWFSSVWKDDFHHTEYGSTPTECVQKLYDYLKENNLLNNNQT